MRKVFAIIGVFALILILSATLCIVPDAKHQAHANNHEFSDAAVAESDFIFVTSSLATVLGMAVVAKRHLVSKIH